MLFLDKMEIDYNKMNLEGMNKYFLEVLGKTEEYLKTDSSLNENIRQNLIVTRDALEKIVLLTETPKINNGGNK